MFDIYKTMWQKRKMINELAKQDIKMEYAGTLLGMMWGLINPLLRIGVYWFVFSVGARAGHPVNGAPYIGWLTIGLVAWFFINDAFKLAKNSFRSKRSIIKNTPFPIAILPAEKVLYAYYIHLILLVAILLVMAVAFKSASIYWLQIFYYDFAACMLLIALGSVTAPLVAVSKDFSHFIDTFLVFLFWMTPILWSVDNVQSRLQYIIKLNPIHYIIQGYRDSFFYGVGFWEHPVYTLYFWGFVFATLVLGNYLFKRMKPVFLDIL
ncbi:ABC transporter permease [Geobacillus stearothermophilus]|uniref:ABC transporter permease n=1 Tax=Geobacillus stearothermophilus TaxID=1422 RepID=UPI003D206451